MQALRAWSDLLEMRFQESGKDFLVKGDGAIDLIQSRGEENLLLNSLGVNPTIFKKVFLNALASS